MSDILPLSFEPLALPALGLKIAHHSGLIIVSSIAIVLDKYLNK
jgi:hypothetical protein